MHTYRRPWYWLVLLCVAAIVLTAMDFFAARSRILENGREFDAAQAMRLRLTTSAIADFLADSRQLAEATADTLGAVRDNRPLVDRLLGGLTLSRADKNIYGIGCFYAPGVFDRRSVLFGPYASVYAGKLHVYNNDDVIYEYTKLFWYRSAVLRHGAITVEGPYTEEGQTYISTIKAFYDGNGRVAGVITVDVLAKTFAALLKQGLRSGDVAYVTNSSGRIVFATAAIPTGGARVEQSALNGFRQSRVHLSSDAALLFADDRTIVIYAAAIAAGIWFVVLLFGIVMVRSWRAREAAVTAEVQAAQLRREIEIKEKIEIELRKAAYTDSLTGLPSRTPFLERVAAAIDACKTRGEKYAVFFIDLDRFNMVNDTLGHVAGDEMLKTIAGRLRAAVPNEAMLARLGGDEFVVVACFTPEAAIEHARSLLAAVREPVLVGSRTFHSGASIGIVFVEPHYMRPDELLRDADIAMYQAKRLGRDRYAIFDLAMRNRVSSESELEADLRIGIQRGEFLPHYQPLVWLSSGGVASFEALVRWRRPNHGVVNAADFVGFAESRGMIDAIDGFMLESACKDMPALLERYPDSSIAVNLSAAHLADPRLVDQIAMTLHRFGTATKNIRLEITETAIMSDADRARSLLSRLRDLGIQIVLDDFGAGQSSLSYLQRLPIAGLKIDQAFIEPLGRDQDAAAIVRSIVALAQTMGLYTVAEGVSTLDQQAVLRELGVVYAQGYLFARPADLETVLAMVPLTETRKATERGREP